MKSLLKTISLLLFALAAQAQTPLLSNLGKQGLNSSDYVASARSFTTNDYLACETWNGSNYVTKRISGYDLLHSTLFPTDPSFDFLFSDSISVGSWIESPEGHFAGDLTIDGTLYLNGPIVGDVALTNLANSIKAGTLDFSGLPTSDPHIKGRLWQSNHVMMISWPADLTQFLFDGTLNDVMGNYVLTNVGGFNFTAEGGAGFEGTQRADSSYSVSGSFSVAVRITVTNIGSEKYLLGQWNDSDILSGGETSFRWILFHKESEEVLQFYLTQPTVVQTYLSTPIAAGVPTLIVATFNAETGVFTLSSATDFKTGTFTGTFGQPVLPFQVGAVQNSLEGPSPTACELYNLRLWNRVLSPSEISAILTP